MGTRCEPECAAVSRIVKAVGCSSAGAEGEGKTLRRTVIAIGAEDNLVKGASGQMLQAANVVLGLPETTGLPLLGVAP